jgi:hypothetical protein
MVTKFATFDLIAQVCWQVQLPLIKRLDPQTRVKVLAAIVALVILGFLMMILAWMGARATRRYMRIGSKQDEDLAAAHTPATADDWLKKPLPAEEDR